MESEEGLSVTHNTIMGHVLLFMGARFSRDHTDTIP